MCSIFVVKSDGNSMEDKRFDEMQYAKEWMRQDWQKHMDENKHLGAIGELNELSAYMRPDTVIIDGIVHSAQVKSIVWKIIC